MMIYAGFALVPTQSESLRSKILCLYETRRTIDIISILECERKVSCPLYRGRGTQTEPLPRNSYCLNRVPVYWITAALPPSVPQFQSSGNGLYIEYWQRQTASNQNYSKRGFYDAMMLCFIESKLYLQTKVREDLLSSKIHLYLPCFGAHLT